MCARGWWKIQCSPQTIIDTESVANFKSKIDKFLLAGSSGIWSKKGEFVTNQPRSVEHINRLNDNFFVWMIIFAGNWLFAGISYSLGVFKPLSKQLSMVTIFVLTSWITKKSFLFLTSSAQYSLRSSVTKIASDYFFGTALDFFPLKEKRFTCLSFLSHLLEVTQSVSCKMNDFEVQWLLLCRQSHLLLFYFSFSIFYLWPLKQLTSAGLQFHRCQCPVVLHSCGHYSWMEFDTYNYTACPCLKQAPQHCTLPTHKLQWIIYLNGWWITR